ncbi:MAG TPA: hypothetical protein VEL79_19080 [Vicinamibacterales bacterium]|nr:hypothetical protein [Vicinamibacterales bacterium]
MADLTDTIKFLERQRDELLDQVNAIIRAIAALKGTDGSVRRTPSPYAPPVDRPAPSQRTNGRKRRQFVLSEEHKQKLLEGQRRAREARLTAGPSAVPDSTAHDAAPRLVRRDPTV